MEYGIWSESDGGFVERQFWSTGAADTAAGERGGPAEGYSVTQVCEYHDDQPAEDCDECAYEDEDGD